MSDDTPDLMEALQQSLAAAKADRARCYALAGESTPAFMSHVPDSGRTGDWVVELDAPNSGIVLFSGDRVTAEEFLAVYDGAPQGQPMTRRWEVQTIENWWLSLGFHIDHTDPSITLHLPGVIVYMGNCKQPGFKPTRRCPDA